MPLDYVPGPPVPLHRLDATFYGFVRAPVSRGVGTRNSLSRLWRHVLPVRDEGRETPGLWSSKRVVHVCQLPHRRRDRQPIAAGPGPR